jgi:hypothetical protein
MSGGRPSPTGALEGPGRSGSRRDGTSAPSRRRASLHAPAVLVHEVVVEEADEHEVA